MKTALVTGAGGFLGRHVVELLCQRGIRVRAVGRHRYPVLEELGVECLPLDIRNASAVERACRGVDTVFHIAAVAGIWGPWKTFHEINTLGTYNVVEACRRHRVARLVYTSSPSVTFDGRAQCGVGETAPYPRRWLCHYPHTKAMAEQYVLAANGGEGLATCALRPHLIWGDRDPHLIPRLLERARRGQLVQVGDGRNAIDITYVDNAALAHVLAAERLWPGSSVAGRAYFISQGEPVNCWQWIGEVLKLAGLPPLRRRISYRVAWYAGAVLEGIFWLGRLKGEPRMTRFLAAQLALPHYFDISAARRDFGYEPIVSTAEGMRRTAPSWGKPA
jgi:nucleoside-diphosphate-sugar epimerase